MSTPISDAFVPNQATRRSDRSGAPDTRIRGRRLALVRLTWIILSFLALVLFMVSLPVYFARQQQSYAVGYAVFLLALAIFVALVWFTVALLIFWRKSNDWLALLVSLMLVLQGANTITSSLETRSSVLLVPALITSLLAFDLLFLVFCLFPNGQFVPRWIGLLAVLFAVLFLAASIVSTFVLLPNFFNLLLVLTFYCLLGGFVVAQLYRYHSVSGPTERQQTKWIVFGVTVTYLFEFGYALCSGLFPSFFSTGSLTGMILLPLGNAIPILIPLSFGFAILRYRLWDIDIIIRRTLIYSTLTIVLAVIYEVSVFTLQFLTGGLALIRGNQLAIFASTLLIGVLVKPVHDRTRAQIDRRFYRRKYDVARTIAAFNTTIRDEVDLDQLCTQLVAVVEETMQPAHVSLWLCPPKHYLEETTRALPFIETIDTP